MSILITDDSESQRLILSAMLKKAGYTDLLEAASGAETLRHLKRADHSIDLILLDLGLPDISGLEICRQIQMSMAWVDVPVIIITASTETQAVQAAFDAGALDYLTKPVNQTELNARVRSALRLRQETERRKNLERQLEKRKDD